MAACTSLPCCCTTRYGAEVSTPRSAATPIFLAYALSDPHTWAADLNARVSRTDDDPPVLIGCGAISQSDKNQSRKWKCGWSSPNPP